jgi:hypothetical protein
MKTFIDNAGRRWTIQVNVDVIRRVRDLVKVNLLEVVEGKLLEQLISDPLLLCDILYVVCKPEAEAQKINDTDFGRAMAGDAIDGATTALLEELVDFFPAGRRQVLGKAISKLKAFETAALQTVQTRLESPELDKHLQSLLQEQLGTPKSLSGSAPASLASTPAASP